MTAENTDYAIRAKSKIESQLKRSLDIRDVELLTEDYETSRFDLGEYEVLLRVTTAPIESMEIIDTLEVLRNHVADEIFDVDAVILSIDNPPAHIVNKGVVFYIVAAM